MSEIHIYNKIRDYKVGVIKYNSNCHKENESATMIQQTEKEIRLNYTSTM